MRSSSIHLTGWRGGARALKKAIAGRSQNHDRAPSVPSTTDARPGTLRAMLRELKGSWAPGHGLPTKRLKASARLPDETPCSRAGGLRADVMWATRRSAVMRGGVVMPSRTAAALPASGMRSRASPPKEHPRRRTASAPRHAGRCGPPRTRRTRRSRPKWRVCVRLKPRALPGDASPSCQPARSRATTSSRSGSSSATARLRPVY